MLEPFKIDVGEGILTDLADRLDRTRFPDGKGLKPWADGTSSTYVADLVAHWQTGFDWRAQEAALNGFTKLRGDVDGSMVHCIHESGKGPAPLPLLLVHGYPDSVWRFHKIIPMLADPAAHGGIPPMRSTSSRRACPAMAGPRSGMTTEGFSALATCLPN
jgi:hypothetical protein